MGAQRTAEAVAPAEKSDRKTSEWLRTCVCEWLRGWLRYRAA